MFEVSYCPLWSVKLEGNILIRNYPVLRERVVALNQ
jgi:hypothetical protein